MVARQVLIQGQCPPSLISSHPGCFPRHASNDPHPPLAGSSSYTPITRRCTATARQASFRHQVLHGTPLHCNFSILSIFGGGGVYFRRQKQVHSLCRVECVKEGEGGALLLTPHPDCFTHLPLIDPSMHHHATYYCSTYGLLSTYTLQSKIICTLLRNLIKVLFNRGQVLTHFDNLTFIFWVYSLNLWHFLT